MEYLRRKRVPTEVDNIGGVRPRVKLVFILVSMFLSLLILICAVMALKDIEHTDWDEEWRAIAGSGLALAVLQITTNIPYIFIQTKKKGTWAYYIWAVYHAFSSAASFTLFFLCFYFIGHHDFGSFKLRANFWTQFKFKWEKSRAHLEAMLAFTDFVGLNGITSLLMVIYPKGSEIWNRNSPENMQISLD